MKKNAVSVLLAGIAAVCMAGTIAVPAEEETVSTDPATYDGKEVKVWVADGVVDFTNEEIAKFQEEYPQYAGVTFTVEPVGEGDAASNVITDVEGAADVFGFAQDQIARLVAAGALIDVNPDYVDDVSTRNDEGSVNAATVGDMLYAYPLTSDNGYFLYYDSSVVTDPTDLDAILADCEAAGKNFYMEINNGWYQTAFFFGTGCELTYETDTDGNFTTCNVDYASDQGLVALKEMIKLNSSSAFQNGSSADNATEYAAIVDGTWDQESIKKMFGDNFACAPLPSFTGSDGETYQLSGFSGYKLLGVKPQEDEDKLQICDDLANFLSGEEAQLDRYNAVGWGPSNINAQQDDAVLADVALTALNQQMLNDVPQGQYPEDYWSLATSLGDDVIQGNLSTDTSDDDLMAALQTFQDTCISYADSAAEAETETETAAE
ncbi:MAG: extracellular solute-binding protein [Lachnospiraceae bacterium]|jgi:arabinogalactan oligomer/maltooligosaccharide transport system substrate-binding protein